MPKALCAATVTSVIGTLRKCRNYVSFRDGKYCRFHLPENKDKPGQKAAKS